jgi:hypothetical protein
MKTPAAKSVDCVKRLRSISPCRYWANSGPYESSLVWDMVRIAPVINEKLACNFWRYDRVKWPGIDDRALASGANEYQNIKGYSKAG